MHGSSNDWFARLGARGLVLGIVVACAASRGFGQSQVTMTYVSRFGTNLAYCGQFGGPSGSHTFTTTTPTADTIAVSDPGGPTWLPSSAGSQLTVIPTPTSLSISAIGNAMRGPVGPAGSSAVADARDQWTFTVPAPVHFTLNVALSATSNETLVSSAAYSFSGSSITPDPGVTPPPYSTGLGPPGTFTLVTRGTLGPGQYSLSVQNRAESIFNSFPFTGGYQVSVTLALQGPALATSRNVPPNPQSYTSSLPRLGQSWSGNVDLAPTNHAAAQIFLSAAATQLALASGQVLLIDFPVFELTPPIAGPQASFSIPLPPDPALAGIFVATQAIQFGGNPSFALSNAIDLTLGF